MLSTNKTRFTPYWVTDLLWLALCLGTFYAIWIGSYALFTPDEGRYSEVAREMIATGDYITPRLNGVAFLDKPILYYWLQASAIKMFGLNEAALRFWPATIGVLGCLVTYLAGNLLFNRRTGIIAALILATCPLYYGAAHYANLDLEVAVLIGNSLLFFIMAMHFAGGKARSACLITAYCFAGLAALTKGLIGIAFPGLIIGMWILLLGRFSTLKRMHIIIGLTLFTAITVPWYVLAQQANPQFFHFFFVTQQFSRFLTKEAFNNRTVIWFYLPIVIAGIFPWSIFVIQAFANAIKNTWKNRQQHSVELFLLLWFFIVFIFFSIPKSKTIGYILPLFPAVALLLGNYLNILWSHPKSAGVRAGLGLFIFISAILSISFPGVLYIKSLGIDKGFTPYLYAYGALFFTSTILGFVLLRKNYAAKAFYCVLATAGVFLLTLTASTSVINQKTIKPLALAAKPFINANVEIATFYKYYQDLPIYLEKRITIVADWNATDIAQNDNWVRELWYGMPFQDTKDWLITENIFWERWNSPKTMVVFTDKNHYDEFKLKAKTKFFEVGRYQNTILISNSSLTKNPELAYDKSEKR